MQALSTTPWASLRTSASHTIGIPHLLDLLDVVPPEACSESYRAAVVDQNVLGRPTGAGRTRTFRHLRELYLLDPAQPEFSVLRHLWALRGSERSLLAALLAFTRDETLRATWPAVASAAPGEIVSSGDLAAAAHTVFGSGLSESTTQKIGRNTGASWTQSGHLHGRTRKTRVARTATPTTTAFATFLAHGSGLRGAQLLDTPWLALLDTSPSQALVALKCAHTAGLLTVRTSGDVIDVDVAPLLEVVA